MSDSNSDSAEKTRITEEDIIKDVEERCYAAFKEYDRKGQGGRVNSDQVQDVLNHMNIQMSDQEIYKIISDIDPENTGHIPYDLFKGRICHREVERLTGNDETELLDAFVAMGGDADGGGCVDAQKLIQTIKEEFQMTIDIEKLIEEIDEDGSGEIEFDEFQALLQSDA